jgi:hypothetical protein
VKELREGDGALALAELGRGLEPELEMPVAGPLFGWMRSDGTRLKVALNFGNSPINATMP